MKQELRMLERYYGNDIWTETYALKMAEAKGCGSCTIPVDLCHLNPLAICNGHQRLGSLSRYQSYVSGLPGVYSMVRLCRIYNVP